MKEPISTVIKLHTVRRPTLGVGVGENQAMKSAGVVAN